MMRTKRFLWCVLALFLLAQAALAESAAPVAPASANLIQNPGFEETDEFGLPVGWTKDMWYWEQGVSELSTTNGSHAGANAILIRNLGENDARFCQSVAVEPNTFYEIKCFARVEGCDEGAIGANLSLDNTFISSEEVADTDGAWKELSIIGKTGSDQTKLTVMARLGGYGSLNVGSAAFDDFSLVKLADAPAAADVFDLSTIPPSSAYYEEDDIETKETAVAWDLVGILALGAGYALLAAGILWIYLRKPRPTLEEPARGKSVFWICAIAFAIRLVIALVSRGYKVDMDCFAGWAARIAETGPAGFYAKDVFCDYPPGYMYVLWLAGSILRACNISLYNRLSWLIVKLTPMIADMLAVWVVYRVAKLHLPARVAGAIACVLAFHPLLILDSAAWGQADMVLTILIVLSMLEAAKGRFWLSLPLFAVAVLVKPQALMFAPLGVMVLILEITQSEEKGKCLLRMLGSCLAAIALFFLLAAPFMLSLDPELLAQEWQISLFGRTFTCAVPAFARPVAWLFGQYGKTLDSYNYMSVNACNLYTLLGMNWVEMDAVPGVKLLSWILMGAAYAYGCFLYGKAKDRGKLFLIAATLLTLVFVFAPKMHERYLFPATVFLLLAYAFDRDVRILIAFVLLSVTQFTNVALVLRSEHLIESEEALNMLISGMNVLLAAFLSWTSWEMCVGGHVIELTSREPTETKARDDSARMRAIGERLTKVRDWRLNLRWQDWLLMGVVTVGYAALTFTNLGSMKAPQTQWRATASGEQVTFDLGAPTDFTLAYYGGICSSTFTVQFSEDGEVWSEAHYAVYDSGRIFQWLWYSASERDEQGEFFQIEPGYPMNRARYTRITAERAGLLLYEIAFLDGNGNVLPIRSVYAFGGAPDASGDPGLLIDEQDTVPAYPSYMNSCYFDEIYHARTAYEHQQGLHAYEYTHPPLGKVLMMVGINLFGMTAFGWRFMGALMGALMLPIMYLMAKQLFRRRQIAFIAMFLLAVDCMHFTQTRIATIDVFVVFFIMLMYLFMFRYAMMSFYHTRLSRTLIPLGLSGISMGLAVACKWTGAYGGVGLALIFFYTMFQRLREYMYAKRFYRALEADQRRISQRAIKQFWKNTVITLLFCVVFFVIIPATIYYFSYYWQLAPDGGLSVEAVVDTQRSMFAYHTTVRRGTHAFESDYYTWPFIVKPIWYYTGDAFMRPGWTSSISCLGNPAVFWFGALAMLFVLARVFTQARTDKRNTLILIGFAAQYLPWAAVPRSMFIYHYFPSVPFIILAIALVFDTIRRVKPRVFVWTASIFCVLAAILFAMFYPIASGLPVPEAYAQYLRWFNWVIY